jgi:hypothetical protein
MTIEEYLAELRRHLRVGPLARRRILQEVESHLFDAAAREGDEQMAVSSFGPPDQVAARFSHPRRFVHLRWFLPATGIAAAVVIGLVLGWQGAAPSRPSDAIPALAMLTGEESESGLSIISDLGYMRTARAGCTTINNASLVRSLTFKLCPTLIAK